MRVTYYRVAALTCLSLALLALATRPARLTAQEDTSSVTVFSVEQQDTDGDGAPDLTVIDCAFITDHDRIFVYDRAGDMVSASTWQEATDFDDDLWLFDANADEHIDLVIGFGRTAEGLLAELWDDQDGDGLIKLKGSPLPEVDESAWPTVRILAPGGWWQRDGHTNFNLDIEVDGQVNASAESRNWIAYLASDGVPDFLITVRDTDDDGRPDYHWIDVWPEAPKTWGVRRTQLMVNPADDEYPLTGSIFWPYLGSALSSPDNPRHVVPSRFPVENLPTAQKTAGFRKSYLSSRPPIMVAWDKGVISHVGEFVASRFNDDSWFLYSIYRAEPGRPATVDFEAPFAFYDLAGDDDGYPEMLIRLLYHPADDYYLWRNNPKIWPIQDIRYAWDQVEDDDARWDFKLSLVGRHLIDETLSVGDLTLKTVPPASLPQWVRSRRWDGATFIAVEDVKYRNSEGIKEWGISHPWFAEYVHGETPDPPEEDYADLPVGLRGELQFDLQAYPLLYFSPVDHKLHLRRAQRGLWRLDEDTTILYESLGGDYIDHWQLQEDGLVTQRLVWVAGFLIHADERENTLRWTRVNTSPALFETLPPADHADWLELGRRFEADDWDAAPGEFLAMAGQFGPPTAQMWGANLTAPQAIAGGYHLGLRLQPDYRISGELPFGLNPVAPGEYALTYDGAWRSEPLPDPSAALALQLEVPAAAQARLEVPLRLSIANQGLSTLDNLLLKVVALNGAGEQVDLLEERFNLAGLEEKKLLADWRPATPEEWQLQATLKGEATADQEGVMSGAKTVAVGEATSSPFLLSFPRPVQLSAFLLLGILGFLVGLTARMSLSSRG